MSDRYGRTCAAWKVMHFTSFLDGHAVADFQARVWADFATRAPTSFSLSNITS